VEAFSEEGTHDEDDETDDEERSDRRNDEGKEGEEEGGGEFGAGDEGIGESGGGGDAQGDGGQLDGGGDGGAQEECEEPALGEWEWRKGGGGDEGAGDDGDGRDDGIEEVVDPGDEVGEGFEGGGKCEEDECGDGGDPVEARCGMNPADEGGQREEEKRDEDTEAASGSERNAETEREEWLHDPSDPKRRWYGCPGVNDNE